eukprot:361574-Chlamydomonas_euryale.AAC.5
MHSAHATQPTRRVAVGTLAAHVRHTAVLRHAQHERLDALHRLADRAGRPSAGRTGGAPHHQRRLRPVCLLTGVGRDCPEGNAARMSVCTHGARPADRRLRARGIGDARRAPSEGVRARARPRAVHPPLQLFGAWPPVCRSVHTRNFTSQSASLDSYCLDTCVNHLPDQPPRPAVRRGVCVAPLLETSKS